MISDGYGDGLYLIWSLEVGTWHLARTLRTKVRIDPEMNTQARNTKRREDVGVSVSVNSEPKKR